MNSKLISPFWLMSAAFALSLAWLLPNHAPPWVSFHGDAWAASILTIVALWVAWKGKADTGWHVLTLAVGLCCLMPWLQYAFGQIPIFGTAWINSLFILGFLFAVLTGEKWELQSPGQCSDLIFTATLIAAVASTGLQIYQWAGLEPIGPWTLIAQGRSRFYANMAQPNQLATLLLLGLLGCSWGFYRAKLSATLAIILASFVLTGVALTESRTAWVNLGLLVLGSVVWRKYLPSKRYLWVVLGLAIYFAACILLLPYALTFADRSIAGDYRSLADPVRISAWKMFFNASLQQPFAGFGWGQVARANFLMIENYPIQQALFNQSHNLILDLILWNGYPLGLLAAGLLTWWVCKIISFARRFEQFHLLAFIIILGTHAMLEYPLQYAVFLLPFGLIVGAIHSSFGFQFIIKRKNWIHSAISVVAVFIFVITVRDYFRVETSFYGLRFENKRIKTDIPSTPPDVIALTQFRDYLLYARNVPKSGLDAHELQRMVDIVNAMPSAHVMYKLAQNLAMNAKPVESESWLLKICKTTPDPNCQIMRGMWAEEALTNEEIANIAWPAEFSK